MGYGVQNGFQGCICHNHWLVAVGHRISYILLSPGHSFFRHNIVGLEVHSTQEVVGHTFTNCTLCMESMEVAIMIRFHLLTRSNNVHFEQQQPNYILSKGNFQGIWGKVVVWQYFINGNIIAYAYISALFGGGLFAQFRNRLEWNIHYLVLNINRPLSFSLIF